MKILGTSAARAPAASRWMPALTTIAPRRWRLPCSSASPASGPTARPCSMLSPDPTLGEPSSRAYP